MNINDLSVLFAAVELAVKRGTFSVFEIGTVGQAAERLGAFLKDATEQAQAAKAEQEAAEGQAPVEAGPDAPTEQA
jgi:nucleotide-binding universal stress UspA family protein